MTDIFLSSFELNITAALISSNMNVRVAVCIGKVFLVYFIWSFLNYPQINRFLFVICLKYCNNIMTLIFRFLRHFRSGIYQCSNPFLCQRMLVIHVCHVFPSSIMHTNIVFSEPLVTDT